MPENKKTSMENNSFIFNFFNKLNLRLKINQKNLDDAIIKPIKTTGMPKDSTKGSL